MAAHGLERAVGRAIGDELRRRGLGAAQVERRLALAAGSLQALVAGGAGFELDVLRRVLTYLDLDPSAFFAQLLGDGDGPAPGPAPGLARQEVAGLVERVRRALLEIDPA